MKDFKATDDYYFVDGLMVMTRKYHLDRGYCCGNKCRHCPYSHVAVPNSQEIDTND